MGAKDGSRWNLEADLWPEGGQYSPIHQSKDVEHGCNIWVAPARCALQVLQCLLTERHGHLVATLSCILDHQVVQSP